MTTLPDQPWREPDSIARGPLSPGHPDQLISPRLRDPEALGQLSQRQALRVAETCSLTSPETCHVFRRCSERGGEISGHLESGIGTLRTPDGRLGCLTRTSQRAKRIDQRIPVLRRAHATTAYPLPYRGG